MHLWSIFLKVPVGRVAGHLSDYPVLSGISKRRNENIWDPFTTVVAGWEFVVLPTFLFCVHRLFFVEVCE